MDKTSSSLISFEIDTNGNQQQVNDKKEDSLFNAFGLSDQFVEIHISIVSNSPEKPSIYTISYSSGIRKFGLQDGMISKYQLEPEVLQTFYYSSKSRN